MALPETAAASADVAAISGAAIEGGSMAIGGAAASGAVIQMGQSEVTLLAAA